METVSYLGCCFILYLLYEVLAVLYRLFLSPIAKFPGSKLTAATSWVETYYDVFKGGQFTHQIEIWHRQYGPIIRISPTEIHVADPDFYDVAYASSAPFDKIPRWRDRFGLPTAVQSTVHHDLHRSRRTALNPFFSKKQINAFSPYIQQCADKVCDRLLHEYRGTDKVLSMTDVYATFATDIIFYYTFAWNYDFMSFPNFIAPFTESIKELALSIHVAGHFPWFLALLQSAPDSVVSVLNPAMRPVFRFQNEVKNQVIQIKEGKNEAYKSVEHKTVFSDLLASDLPPQEKSVTRLQQEAAGIVGAAIETTKTTLTLATFYVLNDSTILKNLKEELERAIPDLSKLPTLAELEQLPYLTAVIQEALRVSYGVAQRLPRVSRNKAIVYNKQWTIPANVPFSMSNYIQHTNEDLFPSPLTFSPERWLNNPKAASAPGREKKQLIRYLVPFSKGTRMCLGQHLAWAELYIGLANVFRRVDLALYKTDLGDVAMTREFFIPLPKPESNGVRVLVK